MLKQKRDKEKSHLLMDPFIDRMKLRLSTVLTVPRSSSTSEVERHAVGDYLARALASTGLVVGLQQFVPKQFRKTVRNYLLFFLLCFLFCAKLPST